MHSSNRNPFSERSWLSCFGESSEILSMTYVVLKSIWSDRLRKGRGSNGTGESIQKRQFFSIMYYSILIIRILSVRSYISIRVWVLVLVSDPGSASPFFRDELLAPVLHFVSVDRGERGLRGKRVVPWEKQGGQLLQIYNMDSGNAMELDPHVDPNESVFSRGSIFAC